jgi:D-3-phosphoglycerate dehydrogenase
MSQNNRRKVLVVQALHPEGMRLLHARPDLEIVVPDSIERATLLRDVADADAIAVRLTRVDADLIAAGPKLQIVSRHGVGFDTIDVEAATRAGVVVATVGLANAPSVTEHTVAMILALAKRLPEFDRAVRTGDYGIKLKLDAIDIQGRSVLIVGLGRIGSRVAKALGALGMMCLGIDPALSGDQIRALGCEPAASLHAALSRADFVTLHCPLQADTRNLIGAAELALMKPAAYLINAARGGIVDEAALVAALDAGRLKGAALDVQATEPPKLDDPLLKNDRIILSPHSAAATQEGHCRMSMTTAQNILDHFDGTLPVSHVVNPDVLSRVRHR